jgi:hypothetical protein
LENQHDQSCYLPYLSFHWAVFKFQIVACTFRLWRSCFCGQLRKCGNQSGCKQQNSVWGIVLLWVGRCFLLIKGQFIFLTLYGSGTLCSSVPPQRRVAPFSQVRLNMPLGMGTICRE